LVFNFFRENPLPFFPKSKEELLIDDNLLFGNPEVNTKANPEIEKTSETKNLIDTTKKDTNKIENSEIIDSGIVKKDSIIQEKAQENIEIDITETLKNARKSKQSEYLIVTYEQMLKIVGNKDFLIIDARRPEQFQESHIKNSINIYPLGEEEEIIEKIFELPQEKTIIIYCDGGNCELSENVAVLLENFGFKRFFIYESGWEEWSKKQKNN
jgi:rhodanese-related sulfurtransferase